MTLAFKVCDCGPRRSAISSRRVTSVPGPAASAPQTILAWRCAMPGTACLRRGRCLPTDWAALVEKDQYLATRRQSVVKVNNDRSAARHDALEFPDGRTVLLTRLRDRQTATPRGQCCRSRLPRHRSRVSVREELGVSLLVH